MISIQRNKIKNLVLGILIFLLILLIATIVYKKGYIKDIINAFEGKKTEKSIIDGILINDVNLIYDSSDKTYYFPVNIENDKEMEIKIKSSKILKSKIEEKEFSKKIKLSKDINYDTTIEIEVESFLYQDNCKIKFTNIPVISINYDETEIGSEYVYSEFSMIDPDYKKNDTKHQFDSITKVRYRGSSTLGFDKKSYRVKLENNIDFGLLGMEKSKTWILDPIVIDPSKLRTKIASDLWRDINKDLEKEKYVELNAKYVEVYINGSYNGLYLLKETIDENLLDLNKDTGVLIKGINWEQVNFNDYNNIDTDLFGPFELKYPKNQKKYSKSWNQILDKLKKYYNNDINYTNINQAFYVENLANYKIFLWTLSAIDNYEFKNLYYSIEDDKKDTKVVITPWDLDMTLGIIFDLGKTIKTYDKIDEIYDSYGVKEDETFKNYIKERWNFLSSTVLSKEEINQKIDKQYEYLTKAGVLQRENRKHHNTENTENEMQEIKDWYSKRFDAMEQYIKSL